MEPCIEEYLEIKATDTAPHHVHVSANERDIAKAVRITKELWPESIVTAPWSSRKKTAFDHAKCEKIYRQLCHYHVAFTTDPRDVHFIVEVLNKVGNIRSVKSAEEKDFVLLAANDSTDDYRDFEERISEIYESEPSIRIEKLISSNIEEISKRILKETNKI